MNTSSGRALRRFATVVGAALLSVSGFLVAAPGTASADGGTIAGLKSPKPPAPTVTGAPKPPPGGLVEASSARALSSVQDATKVPVSSATTRGAPA